MVLRGDPWAPESSSPTGATKLGLVVGQGAYACLGYGPDGGVAGAGQGMQSWGQQPTLLAPASSFPGFLTLFSMATEGGRRKHFSLPSKLSHREREKDERFGGFKFWFWGI